VQVSKFSAFQSFKETQGLNGDYSKTSEGRKKAQVLDAQAQPLQALRTPARLSAQVRHLPLVLPPARAARGDSRGFEVFVVTRRWALAVVRNDLAARANDKR
jgi:hypothetical protein